MFEKYNDSARRALFFSRYEASARGDQLIDTHHLLLGVLRENDATTRALFDSLRVDPSRFRELWPATIDRVSSSAELPLSDDAKKALAYTAHESQTIRATEVAPFHLLLGILRTTGSRGATALAEAGLTYGAVVETGQAIAAQMAQRRASEERTPFVLRSSHYALIDRIREQIGASRNRPASREEVVLALMDGFSANPEHFPTVESIDELRVRIAEAIAGLPGG